MTALLTKGSKYLAVSRISIRNSITHGVALFSRTALIMVRIWILLYLYTAIYQGSFSQTINGLTLPMVMWSIALTQSFQAATRPAISLLIAEEIQSGTIAYALSRPYSYLFFHFSQYWGNLLPRLAINLIIALTTVWLLVGSLSITPASLLLSLTVLICGYTLEFVFFLFLGLCAFQIEDINPLLWNYNKTQIIFSGLVLPVSLFPNGLRQIAEFLPFTQVYYSAARLMVNFDFALFVQYLLTQTMWLIVLIPLVLLYFRKAIRNVAINGG